MKLKSFTVRRTESYQTPANTLVGTVDLIEEGGGALTVTLSTATLLKVCNIISAEVGERARFNASRASTALTEAAAELQLAEDAFLAIPSEK